MSCPSFFPAQVLVLGYYTTETCYRPNLMPQTLLGHVAGVCGYGSRYNLALCPLWGVCRQPLTDPTVESGGRAARLWVSVEHRPTSQGASDPVPLGGEDLGVF